MLLASLLETKKALQKLGKSFDKVSE